MDGASFNTLIETLYAYLLDQLKQEEITVIIDSILSINSSYIESMIRDNLDSLTIDRPEILEKIYNSNEISI